MQYLAYPSQHRSLNEVRDFHVLIHPVVGEPATIHDRDQVSDFGSPAMSRYTTRDIPKDNSIAIVGDCRERRRSGYCRILPEIWEVMVRKSPVVKGWDNGVSICNPSIVVAVSDFLHQGIELRHVPNKLNLVPQNVYIQSIKPY